jgi:hypothetical protein
MESSSYPPLFPPLCKPQHRIKMVSDVSMCDSLLNPQVLVNTKMQGVMCPAGTDHTLTPRDEYKNERRPKLTTAALRNSY